MKKKVTLPIAIEFATNMFGRLKPDQIKRIERFLKRPTFDTWDDISSIIIDGTGRMKTIWNAVKEVDAFFPSYGRTTDLEGNVTREWERIPDPETVVEAIKKVCLAPKNLN